MMKKGKATRIIVNGALLAAIVALGVTVFQAGSGNKKAESVRPEIAGNDLAQAELVPDEAPMVDAGSSHVEMEVSEGETIEMADATDSNHLMEAQEEISAQTAETVTNNVVDQQAGDPLAAQVNFTEDTLMQWPVEGAVAVDYSMDKTVYFPTLDQYRVSPAVVIQAEEGSSVMAAVTGTVSSIAENEETGTTLTLDLGNGYEAVYGQLKDVAVTEGETVETGAILGTVSAPTKYYSLEGSNVYFAMRKDGIPVDPVTYLP